MTYWFKGYLLVNVDVVLFRDLFQQVVILFLLHISLLYFFTVGLRLIGTLPHLLAKEDFLESCVEIVIELVKFDHSLKVALSLTIVVNSTMRSIH